jgi:hypothetical protein
VDIVSQGNGSIGQVRGGKGRKYVFSEKSSRKKDMEKVPAKRCLCAHPALFILVG